MKDVLREMTCSPVTPLRRCEWCTRAAERGGELCDACRTEFVEACHKQLGIPAGIQTPNEVT